MVVWDIDFLELWPLLFEMFAYQNELIESLEVGEDENERSSHDFLEAVHTATVAATGGRSIICIMPASKFPICLNNR